MEHPPEIYFYFHLLKQTKDRLKLLQEINLPEYKNEIEIREKQIDLLVEELATYIYIKSIPLFNKLNEDYINEILDTNK